MKIKLSKAQWELIGNKTGWLKTSASADSQEEGMAEPQSMEEAYKAVNHILDSLNKFVADPKGEWKKRIEWVKEVKRNNPDVANVKITEDIIDRANIERITHDANNLSFLFKKYPALFLKYGPRATRIMEIINDRYRPMIDGKPITIDLDSIEDEAETEETKKQFENRILDPKTPESKKKEMAEYYKQEFFTDKK
jgi:hypothetical protein